MAKKTYIGINNNPCEVKCIYIGIKSIVKKVKQAFIGGKDGKPKLVMCAHVSTYTDDQVDATCGNDGYTGDTYCSDCDDLLGSGSEIPATGEHSYAVGSYICSVCNQKCTHEDTLEDYKGAGIDFCTKCQWHSDHYDAGDNKCEICGEDMQAPHECSYAYTRDATAEEETQANKLVDGETGGYHVKVCSCGKILEWKRHSWPTEGVITTEPTCTTEGEKTFTCTGCGGTYTSKVEALGHAWPDNWSYDKEAHFKQCSNCPGDIYELHKLTSTVQPANCVSVEQTTYKCKVCEYSYTEQTGPENPNAHDWIDADCTTPKTCRACGVTSGGPLGHNLVNGICTICTYKCDHSWVETGAKAATCTTSGISYQDCTVCGAQRDVVIPADHKYTYSNYDESTHIVGCSACDHHDLEGHTPAAVSGNKHYTTCSDCGADSIVAKGHEEIRTELGDGSYKITCKSCNYEESGSV